MRHLTPPGTFGAPAVDEVGTGYDPEYARQQLAASSYPACRLLPDMIYMTGPSDRQLQQAQLIRQMWVEELDCNEEQIRITQVQFGELLANTREGANPAVRPDIWELGWRPYFPDAHNWLHDLLHCSESENRSKRPCSALYRQLERDLFADDGLMPIVPLFSRADYLARQSWLQYPPAYFGGEHYDFYVIDQTVKDVSRSR
jgi:ABC-type oligopeptide transport system substrate-binding subunit